MIHSAAARTTPAATNFASGLQKHAAEFEVAGAHRKAEHQQKIDPGADRGCEREADLGQRAHQRDLQRHIDGDAGQRRLDRGRGILARIEGCDRAADQHERNKPDRIGRQRGARGRGVGLRERAAREHRPHDHVRHGQERGDERHRKQQREIERPPLRRHGAGVIVRGQPPRHFRQQHRADRDPDHADRQLVETVGIIQRRQRAGRQKRRDDGVGEQRDLRPHRAEGRRPERAKERAHILIELERREPRQDAAAGRDRRPAGRIRRKPAIRTPQAAAWPAPGKNAASASVAIIDRLRKIGAAAALAKRCMTLSMPP